MTPTTSPSMDIQVSSNFERLLFEALDRDAGQLQQLMNNLSQSGSFTVPDAALAAIRRDFSAGRADEPETAAAIRSTLERSGYLLDPHTAVGVAVAVPHIGVDSPVVTLSTAHPAKFPAAVKAAAGVEPPLPAWLADLYRRPERYDVIANDQAAIEAYVLERTRA